MNGCTKRLVAGAITFFGCGIGLIMVLFWPVEHTRYADPTGNYEVVITSPLMFGLVPGMPGQGSDRPGDISIYDNEGNFYGTHPLDMLQNGYGIEWTETGAYLPFVGEWEFESD